MTSHLAPPPVGVASPRARQPIVVGMLALGGTAIVAVGNPNTTHVPLCPLNAATGLDCPFCGSLRAVHALTRLDVGAALDHNLLFTAAAPALVFAWAIWLVRSTGRRLMPRLRLPAATGPIVLVVALAFAVARNLPGLDWLGSGA